MPSQILLDPGTPILWTDAGNTPDRALDLGGLAGSGGIKMGAHYDLGVAPRPDLFLVEFFIDGFDSAPQVGQVVDLFFAQSPDGSNFDGQPTTAPDASTEGTITAEQAFNTTYVGSVRVYSTTAGDELQNHFVVRLPQRYISPIVINRVVSDALLSSSDFHRVRLTPIPYEAQ